MLRKKEKREMWGEGRCGGDFSREGETSRCLQVEEENKIKRKEEEAEGINWKQQ